MGNAGHCPPLRVSKGEVTPVEATGLPVGMFAQGQYALRKMRLSPGDSLVLYTDGFSEARNRSGTEYGDERLRRILGTCGGAPPEQVIRRCLDDLAAFQEGSPRRDDLTLMVIHRVEP